MKRGVIQRAATTELAHLVDDRSDGATGESPPRRGRAVSEAIVSRFVTAFDGIAIFGTGIVAMQWHSSTLDWRLEGLVVLLGSLLGLNFLRLAGADRFNQFADLGTSIGRALLGWLLTLALSSQTSSFLAQRILKSPGRTSTLRDGYSLHVQQCRCRALPGMTGRSSVP